MLIIIIIITETNKTSKTYGWYQEHKPESDAAHNHTQVAKCNKNKIIIIIKKVSEIPHVVQSIH